MGSSIVGLIVFILIVLALRLLGSWMLRIDDVIKELRKINNQLSKKDENQN